MHSVTHFPAANARCHGAVEIHLTNICLDVHRINGDYRQRKISMRHNASRPRALLYFVLRDSKYRRPIDVAVAGNARGDIASGRSPGRITTTLVAEVPASSSSQRFLREPRLRDGTKAASRPVKMITGHPPPPPTTPCPHLVPLDRYRT